jgi:uncharacterized glyoxalase superfamily protein PhnB
MLADEHPENGIRGPESMGGTSFSVHLHVNGVDDWVARAARAGATVLRQPANQFTGERVGSVQDPFGHEWLLGETIEAISREEMQRRFAALFE